MFIKGDEKINDKLLLLQLKQGSREAFDALYDQYWKLAYASAFKRLQNEDAAKDITQDVFLQLWLKKDVLNIESLPAFLYIAVQNRVFSFFEKQRKFIPVSDLVSIPSQNADQADVSLRNKEFINAYDNLLAGLPATQRKVMHLRYDQDLSTTAIAAELDLSRKTVQNHLSSVLTRIRSSLTAITVFLLILNCCC